MSGAWHGGKGDRIPGANDAAFQQNYPDIDWTRRAREAGCPQCGSTGLHACTGQPMQPWTTEDKANVRDAMAEIVRREQEQTP